MDTDESEPIGGRPLWRHLLFRSSNGQSDQMAVKALIWLTTTALKMTGDGARATVSRLSSHGMIIFMALVAIVLSGVNVSFAPGKPHEGAAIAANLLLAQASNTQVASVGTTDALDLRPVRAAGSDVLVRHAVPSTQIPDRLRESIITYTVQPGDTLFGIALLFNLAPETVLWANPDLKDNPDLMNVGMVLDVPPLDGVVHVVQDDDTLESIAEKYKVQVDAIVNAEWNSLRQGQKPIAGQHLIVPGGKRELVVWQLPVKSTGAAAVAFASAHAGFCAGVEVAALGTGSFIWPESAHRLGGNPYAYWHRAIDLPQPSGNPVYASDNGTVVYAGWNTWGYGNLIVLDHGNGWQTWYAHLSQIYVGCGQQLYQGAVIGAIGSTGRSTGPHLHFETRLNGDLPNPLNVLP